MTTVNEFAKAHDLADEDVLDLANELGFQLEHPNDTINDDLKKELQSFLEKMGGKTLAKTEVKKLKVGFNKTVTVVTKKKKQKFSIDLDALKSQIRKEKQDDVKTDLDDQQEQMIPAEHKDEFLTTVVEKPELHQPRSAASDSDTVQLSDKNESMGSNADSESDESLSVIARENVLETEQNIENLSSKEDFAIFEIENKTETKLSHSKLDKIDKKITAKQSVEFDSADSDDGKKSSVRKSKKRQRTAQVSYDSSQLDNSLLKRISTNFIADDDDSNDNGVWRKKSKKDKKQVHQFNKPVRPVTVNVNIPEQILVSELAKQMNIKAVLVLKELMKLGMMTNLNSLIDRETAMLVVEELGHTAVAFEQRNPEDFLNFDYPANKSSRPPVVTIMGHVDHGKTSLLDYIRRSRVAASEAGGITQHIGAYSVELPQGKITFLDTPGHAAFTSMRARGAQCTDIAIIVVAADDGVMPQTKEAILHAKAAKVPIIVAVNKIDKPDIDLEKLKNQLSQLDVLPEEWGGDVPFIPVSAKTGEGIPVLLETILIQAELLELTAFSSGRAQGIILESSLSKYKGPVATVLIQQGKLKVGDLVVCGLQSGKVKSISNDLSIQLDSAGPSEPVEILGLSGVVDAGEHVTVVENEKQARDIIDYRQLNLKPALESIATVSLESLLASTNKNKELNIILKADTHGSVEAITQSLKQISTEEVSIRMIAQGVGGINESDVILAKASKAIIIGFNTRADKNAKFVAEKEGVSVYYFGIIYELFDKVKSVVHGLESPKFVEEIVGLAEVKSVFRSSKFGNIAGCLVVDGSVKKDLPIRVLRQHIVIYQGKLESLRRHKDDVSDVRAGTECGIGVKDYNDIKEGDQIEVYRLVEVQR